MKSISKQIDKAQVGLKGSQNNPTIITLDDKKHQPAAFIQSLNFDGNAFKLTYTDDISKALVIQTNNVSLSSMLYHYLDRATGLKFSYYPISNGKE